LCLVVSEERSEVSTVTNSDIKTWDTPEALSAKLIAWLGVPDSPAPELKEFVKSTVIENWRYKLGALGLVAVAWLVLASQQEANISIAASIQYVNVPTPLVLDEKSAKSVSLKISGPRNRYM
jgi:hypothetical protein